MEVNYATVLTENNSSSIITQKRKRAAIVHPANWVTEGCKRVKVDGSELNCKEGSVVYDSLSVELHGCPTKLLTLDSQNFERSGLLSRLMFYDHGEWKDVIEDAITALANSFKARESTTILLVDGRRYLFDFVRMMQLNMQTGYLRSIAWIDTHGKCFFPSKCVEGYRQTQLLKATAHLQLGIDCFHDIVLASSNDSKVGATMASSEETSETSKLTSYVRVGEEALRCTKSLKVHLSHDFTLLRDKIIKLDEAGQEFKAVRDRFLTGLGMLASHTTICAVFRDCHKSNSGQARLLAFKKQEEITGTARGDANIRYAWHGTSKQGISGIILHGFGQPRVPKNGAMYGVGVYLAPEDYSHISAVYSDVDENGEQHMVLCRAILGSMEQVALGSEQFHPSSEDHDTGVDDMNNPKRHIIWSTHMNTHILPEHIVSFKLDPAWRDVIAALRGKQTSDKRSVLGRGHRLECQPMNKPVEDGLEPCKLVGSSQGSFKRVPRSPWMSFPMLFLVLKHKLSDDKMAILQKHYLEFKSGRLSRDVLIKLVRLVAGDNLLANSIRNMQVQGKANEPTDFSSPISNCGTLPSFKHLELEKDPNKQDPMAISMCGTTPAES